MIKTVVPTGTLFIALALAGGGCTNEPAPSADGGLAQGAPKTASLVHNQGALEVTDVGEVSVPMGDGFGGSGFGGSGFDGFGGSGFGGFGGSGGSGSGSFGGSGEVGGFGGSGFGGFGGSGYGGHSGYGGFGGSGGVGGYGGFGGGDGTGGAGGSGGDGFPSPTPGGFAGAISHVDAGSAGAPFPVEGGSAGAPFPVGGSAGTPAPPPDFGDLAETINYFATALPKDLTFTDDFPVASADELREAVLAGLDASGNLAPYEQVASSAFYRLSAFDVSQAELALAELVRRSSAFVSADLPTPPPPPPPNGEKTVPVSLRLARFIPKALGKDGPNLVVDLGGGKKETVWPFTLLTPSIGPTARFFFGDNRDFSDSPDRTGRVNVKIDGAATYDAQMKLLSIAEPKLETWANKTRDFVPTAAEERALKETFGAASAYAINHAARLGQPGIPDAWAMPAAMLEELQAEVKHVTPPDVKRVEGAGFKQISFDVNVRGWHPGITTPPNVPAAEEIFKIAAVRAKMKGYVRFYDQCKIELKAEIEGSAFPNEDLSLRVGDKDVLVCSFKAMTINGMPLRHPETGLMYDRPVSTCRALRETCDGPWKTADVSSATANANASHILGSPASLAQPHLAQTLLQIERDAIAAGVPPAAEPVHDHDKKEYKDGYDRGKFVPANQLCARGPSGAYTGLVKIQETSDAAKSWCTNEPTKYTPGTPKYDLCYTGYIAGVTTVCIGARP